MFTCHPARRRATDHPPTSYAPRASAACLIRLPAGGELRAKRTELGLTQKEVADRAGISQPLVARIEKGGVDPRLSTLNKLVDVLNSAATEQLPLAKDLIEGGIASVAPNETVRRAVQMMRDKGFSQIPVLERGKPVGLVSTDDLIDRVQQSDDPKALGRRAVSGIMTPPPPVVAGDTHFSIVEGLLARNPAVLVQEEGRFVGIITKADLLRVI